MAYVIPEVSETMVISPELSEIGSIDGIGSIS